MTAQEARFIQAKKWIPFFHKRIDERALEGKGDYKYEGSASNVPTTLDDKLKEEGFKVIRKDNTLTVIW